MMPQKSHLAPNINTKNSEEKKPAIYCPIHSFVRLVGAQFHTTFKILISFYFSLFLLSWSGVCSFKMLSHDYWFSMHQKYNCAPCQALIHVLHICALYLLCRCGYIHIGYVWCALREMITNKICFHWFRLSLSLISSLLFRSRFLALCLLGSSWSCI